MEGEGGCGCVDVIVFKYEQKNKHTDKQKNTPIQSLNETEEEKETLQGMYDETQIEELVKAQVSCWKNYEYTINKQKHEHR